MGKIQKIISLLKENKSLKAKTVKLYEQLRLGLVYLKNAENKHKDEVSKLLSKQK